MDYVILHFHIYEPYSTQPRHSQPYQSYHPNTLPSSHSRFPPSNSIDPILTLTFPPLPSKMVECPECGAGADLTPDKQYAHCATCISPLPYPFPAPCYAMLIPSSQATTSSSRAKKAAARKGAEVGAVIDRKQTPTPTLMPRLRKVDRCQERGRRRRLRRSRCGTTR